MPARPPRNIVLIGFMGTGKSTVGRVLAERIGFELVDTDAEIVRLAGCPITEVFEREGEDGFRAREAEELASLRGREGLIISTGGGIVVEEANRAVLRGLGFVVWLDADAKTVYERVAQNRDRPLLNTRDPRGTIRRLLAQRQPLYAETCHLRITIADLNTAEIAYGIRESAEVFFSQTTRETTSD